MLKAMIVSLLGKSEGHTGGLNTSVFAKHVSDPVTLPTVCPQDLAFLLFMPLPYFACG